MNVLRRALQVGATLWALFGLLLAVVPVWVLESGFGQEPLDEYTWVRILGIQCVGTAMLMVMVAHRIETLWWFSWAFVLVFGGVALVSVLNVLFSLAPGASALAWWLLAAATAALATALVIGLARTGLERPAE
jgi:hypothetical protein